MNTSKIIIVSLSSYLCAVLASAQDSQGFFLSNTKSKEFVLPQCIPHTTPKDKASVQVIIYKNDTVAKVSDYIYGNNANVYMTQIVNQNNLPEYIKDLSPNIIRYPGGNLSNIFFWNGNKNYLPPGVPEVLMSMPDRRFKENYWLGNNNGDSTLSVDNYYNLLDMVNATGIICVNYGYARYGLSESPVAQAAHYAADWVRYDKGRTKFWEIGNENFGSWQAGYRIDTLVNRDNQPEYISGALYGKHFNVFADSMRKAANETGSEIKIGAVLEETNKPWADDIEKNWNNGFFKEAGNSADFYIIHSYYTPWQQNSDIATILNSAADESSKMMNFVKEECINNHVELKPVALTEWNIFAINSKQSCSYINGLHATLVLGELIKNKYGQASRWNFANGYANGDDHGMFNIGDEPGVPKWNPRPAYFYMYYFQKFFGDYMINSVVEGSEDVVAYASTFGSGQTGLVIVNKGPQSKIVDITSKSEPFVNKYYFYTLTGGTDNGNFSQQVFVNGNPPSNLTGGPINNLKDTKALSSLVSEGTVKLEIPAYSAQFILIE